MPWRYMGVRRRLMTLGTLAIVGGLLLMSANSVMAQGTREDHVSGDYVSGERLRLEIPGTFFPGFDATGFVEVQTLSLMLGADKASTATLVVQPLRLEESQTTMDLIAPNPDKAVGSTVRYLGRAVRVSVERDGADVSASAWFNPPFTVNLDLTDSEWAEAANDPDAFVARMWDPDRDMWLTLETYTNPFDRDVTARATRVGDIALFIELTPPPIQGGDLALNSATLLLIALGGLALTVTGVRMTRGFGQRRRT